MQILTGHAVSRLRTERLASSAKPFLARGGSRVVRCPVCRVALSHCLCSLRPSMPTRAGVCLIMGDIEPLKPSNTGWLIADLVVDTFAFGWARTHVDPQLLALLADPQWQPYLVFPGEFVDPARVVTQLIENAKQCQLPAGPPQGQLAHPGGSDPLSGGAWGSSRKKPLFVLLDATWPEARKMFRKSPYLDHLPVLSLQPGQISSYRLRRSTRDDHFCTSEVAALCMSLAGEPLVADVLEAYLDVFTLHYLNARQQMPVDLGDAAHLRLQGLRVTPPPHAILD